MDPGHQDNNLAHFYIATFEAAFMFLLLSYSLSSGVGGNYSSSNISAIVVTTARRVFFGENKHKVGFNNKKITDRPGIEIK